MKKRVTYLDLAKGIGIILVVLGHMENINAGLRTWISSFHMPLFFVISGMLIALKNEDEKLKIPNVSECESGSKWAGIKLLATKKAKGILVPYAWFSLIYIPIDIMNLYINNVDKHTFVQNILDSLTFSGISVMWFLPALFIAELTALYVIMFIKSICNTLETKDNVIENNQFKNSLIALGIIIVIGLIISLASFGIWNIGFRSVYEANSGSYLLCTILGFVRVLLRGLAMSYHVLIGYVVYKVVEYADSKINKSLNIVAGVILFALNLGLYAKNGDVDNHFLTVTSMPLYYVCAFLGSVSVILICKGLDTIKPIDFLGRNSLIIMATHLQCYILYAGILIAIAIDAHVTRAKSYIYMFNSVLFTMLIETVFIIIINKFFPFITGKGSIRDSFSSIFNKKNKIKS